jgi:uncharacterized membrane protein
MLDGLASPLLAGLVFVGSHVLISSTRLRGSLRESLGEGGYLGLYSGLAAVTLGWFVIAFARAPVVTVWTPPPWTHFVPVALMPVAALLLVAGLTTRNPTAVGQERRAREDDPAPGILRVTRHPVMWAFGLWGLGHLASNGDGAAIIFFGLLTLLALVGTRLIDRRKRLALGTDWSRLAEVTSNLPFAAIIAGRARISPRDIGMTTVLAALLLYAVLFLAHPYIVGMPVVLP